MLITVNPQTNITILNSDFVAIMNNLLRDVSLDAPEIVALNFRDPTYSASNGGYHPVEIHVDSTGEILCITDFAYFGMPPFAELGIELDWNFEQESFRQFDSFYDLECGRGLLGLYTKNFVAYHKGGCYETEVTAL
jgi:hypothetical protein